MPQRLPVFLSLVITLMPYVSVMAEQSNQAGLALVQQHCIQCHASSYGGDGSAIYTREYRKVRSLAGLKAQVTNCNTQLNLKWFDDEELQVVQYLNASYYHF